MKKKLFIIILVVLTIIIGYFIYSMISYNNLVNNTIYYKDKINYDTSVTTSVKGMNTLKIKYEQVKSSNIKKTLLTNYMNNKLENEIQKYIVDGKTYVYNNGKYQETKEKEKININYKLLKKIKLKKYFNNTYKIKMKAYDAYNLIYSKDVMKKKDLDYYIYITIKKDSKNNFIKEISYKIDNLNNNKTNPLIYSVKIINKNINNNDNIDLPF